MKKGVGLTDTDWISAAGSFASGLSSRVTASYCTHEPSMTVNWIWLGPFRKNPAGSASEIFCGFPALGFASDSSPPPGLSWKSPLREPIVTRYFGGISLCTSANSIRNVYVPLGSSGRLKRMVQGLPCWEDQASRGPGWMNGHSFAGLLRPASKTTGLSNRLAISW